MSTGAILSTQKNLVTHLCLVRTLISDDVLLDCSTSGVEQQRNLQTMSGKVQPLMPYYHHVVLLLWANIAITFGLSLVLTN
jgi:hypothetical protein